MPDDPASREDVATPARPALTVAVLGAGAMGSLFGGLMAQAGAEVSLLDVNQVLLDAINANGLRLTLDGDDLTIHLPAHRPEQQQQPADCVLVFTKSFHTAAALDMARKAIGPDTLLVSLQNGLGNREQLEQVALASQIAVGVTTCPADLVGPGHVASHGDGKIRLNMVDASHCDRLARLVALLRQAGLDAAIDPHVEVAVWEKVAFNAALNTLCAVTSATVGEVGADQGLHRLAHAIVGEVAAVAEAQGLAFDRQRVIATVDHALAHHLTHKPSMLQDLIAGRRTEIEAICGQVVARAGAAGLSVPVTQTMLALVSHLDARGRRATTDTV